MGGLSSRIGYFPRIARGVGVGDVVGDHLHGALLCQQGLEGDGHGTEKARHNLFPHRGERHPLGSSKGERVRARIVRQEIQQDVYGSPGTPEQFRMDSAKPAHVGLNGFESAQQKMKLARRHGIELRLEFTERGGHFARGGQAS